MVQKKRKSKRIPLAVKHKVEKRVREHHRKLRKEARTKGLHHKSGMHGGACVQLIFAEFKKGQDVDVPNIHPFKAELMAQMGMHCKIVIV